MFFNFYSVLLTRKRAENILEFFQHMQIPEIKQHLSIHTVLSRYGHRPDRNNMLRCPFHDDKKASMKIYPGTNTAFCFAAGCKTGGKSIDTIDYIMHMENISKHEAILKAKELAGSQPQPATQTLKHTPMETTEKELLPRLAILSKIASDSRAGFKRTKKARDYLLERGLNPDRTEAGYIGADFGKGWNSQLRESGLKLGILKKSRQNTIVPAFKNCILFFTRNNKGQIIDIYGRSILPEARSKHFYLSGRHQGLYPQYPAGNTKKLVITESFIDCETLAGQESITKDFRLLSLFGTNGFTGEMEEAIKELPQLEEVVFFLDGDTAGREATTKLTEKLLKLRPRLTVTTTETPEGEDANSLLQGHEPEILHHLIKERKPVVKNTVKDNKPKEENQPTPQEP